MKAVRVSILASVFVSVLSAWAQARGADVVPFSSDGESSFVLIDSGSKEALNQMLRHEAMLGKISQIEKLIAKGADVNSTAEYGETALYYSILFGRMKASIKLLELGANPNLSDELDRTPLLKATQGCNFRVSRELLKAGADINHADYYGRNALMNAAESGCARIVALLLVEGKNRIDLGAQDQQSRTALDYASHPWIQKMIADALSKRGSQPLNATLRPPKALD